MKSLAFAAAAAVMSLTWAGAARAADPWVDRHIVLPRHDWAFDFGLGIGHTAFPERDSTGVGFNIEGAVAVTSHLELGLRTGIRAGTDGQLTRADEYGRLFDRQTFDPGGDTLANPEFRIRGAIVEGRVVDFGLEGRVVLPVSRGTHVGLMFGVPLAFHLGRSVRLDTGAYVPIIFDPRTNVAVSLPLNVWIQASNRVWLGPMVDTRIGDDVHFELGFGLGYQISSALDFKTMLMFPQIDDLGGARQFGVGAGLQVRIE
jgi:hypothetical protein